MICDSCIYNCICEKIVSVYALYCRNYRMSDEMIRKYSDLTPNSKIYAVGFLNNFTVSTEGNSLCHIAPTVINEGIVLTNESTYHEPFVIVAHFKTSGKLVITRRTFAMLAIDTDLDKLLKDYKNAKVVLNDSDTIMA